ncbi:MAG TPA: hypothetical protein QF646_00555 [Candidatus Poseidoniales archaeon]|nr:hypothetical protein [Candidatus Poseidoniales archaeon]
MTNSVRCGGHATLLFAVEPQPTEQIDQGSIGVGVCFDAGVDVHVLEDEGSINHVFVIEGVEESLIEAVETVARQALKHTDSGPLHLLIRLNLPFSRGFGMSAAVAAAVALITRPGEIEAAIAIAHLVDRELSGGLGDAAGLAAGGIERRLSIGSPWRLDGTPGNGEVKGFSIEVPVLLLWGVEKEQTAAWIDDEMRASVIRAAGRNSLQMLGQSDWSPAIWPRVIQAADEFLCKSGFDALEGLMNLLNKAREMVRQNRMDDHVVVLPCFIGASVLIAPRYLNTGDIDMSALINDDIAGRCLLTRVSKNPLREINPEID